MTAGVVSGIWRAAPAFKQALARAWELVRTCTLPCACTLPRSWWAWARAWARARARARADAHAHASTFAAAALLASACATATAQPRTAPPPQTVSHGLFSDVRIYRPSGPVEQFVLMPTTMPASSSGQTPIQTPTQTPAATSSATSLPSSNTAPGAAEQRRVDAMVAAGAMVAVVPLAPFYRRLEAQDGKCTSPGGAFENLSRHLQAFEQLPTYLTPMLVGGEGAAPFVYAMLAQTPPGIFASVVSPGFCPRLELPTPLCATNALRWQPAADGRGVLLAPPPAALTTPWVAIEGNAVPPACPASDAAGFVQRVPGGAWAGLPPSRADGVAAAAFDAAYRALAVRQLALAPPPQQLADLPIVEVPAVVGARTTPANARRFVVLLSGDGGWAGIDKGLAAALTEQGVPVAGFDSLRYFWSARTPEGLAADLDRVIRFYAARWKRSEVILIGYSQGADVLPFAINRLPAATRARVRLSALLGLGQKASFEFHLANWIGPSGDRPIAPEARRLVAAETLCLYGEAERDSLCPALAPQHVRAVPLAGGHHFGGEYAALAGRILGVLPP